jgi:hypothetical protein
MQIKKETKVKVQYRPELGTGAVLQVAEAPGGEYNVDVVFEKDGKRFLKTFPKNLLTPVALITKQWLYWAEWMVSNFQRTSSAVEGRNGCLSQMHHNGRGITIKRLKALTAIHNFGLTRSDGTTAAERLFERDFPDLFEWLIKQMGDLPLSRRGRKSSADNLLNLQIVPA